MPTHDNCVRPSHRRRVFREQSRVISMLIGVGQVSHVVRSLFVSHCIQILLFASSVVAGILSTRDKIRPLVHFSLLHVVRPLLQVPSSNSLPGLHGWLQCHISANVRPRLVQFQIPCPTSQIRTSDVKYH